MKVCPYCRGITEEKNAIKCAICGKDISKEKEYLQEELEDELVKEDINQNIQSRKIKKIKKKISIYLGFILIIALVITISILLKPKGYVNVPINTYTAKIGDRIAINLEYGGKIRDKDVELEIVSSDYDGKKISFRYEIVDSICYINCYMTDQITLKFNVKDNGEQYKYNNIVNISIKE